MLALADTDIAELTGTREVLAVLVERNRHDTISRVEGLFDAIAVVNINIDIKNTLLETQQLKDSENNICRVLVQTQRHINFKHLTIDVTEATCFTLLGVVQTTSPVNSNIALVAVQSCSTFHTASSANSAELKQTVEDGAIVTHVVPALFF
jgi:hypothetical protein